MKYLAELLLLSLGIFTARKAGKITKLSTPFRNLGIFNLHYMLAGIIITVLIPDDFMLTFESIRGIVLTFGLCWIGLYYGCSLELRVHQRFPSQIILFNIIEPVIVFAVVSVVSVIYLYYKVEGWHHTATALMIGLFASFTMFRRRGIMCRTNDTSHHPILDNLLPVGDIFPITGLALMTMLLFDIPEITILDHTFTSVYAVFILQLITGLTGGILLNMLISGTDSSDSLSVVLLGGSILIGGIAFTFSFSPLFMGTLSGIFLINSTLKRLQTLEALNDSHTLIEKIFMFCLGTMVTPLVILLKMKMINIFVSAVGLYALRAVVKYILSMIWISRKPSISNGSPILWIGLTGQGILASAAALECSYNVPGFTSVFSLFIILLVLNQFTIGMYVWFREKAPDIEDAENA